MWHDELNQLQEPSINLYSKHHVRTGRTYGDAEVNELHDGVEGLEQGPEVRLERTSRVRSPTRLTSFEAVRADACIEVEVTLPKDLSTSAISGWVIGKLRLLQQLERLSRPNSCLALHQVH